MEEVPLNLTEVLGEQKFKTDYISGGFKRSIEGLYFLCLHLIWLDVTFSNKFGCS
jgi:hypothetical protein